MEKEKEKKFNKFLDAVRNPPPERLHKVNMQSNVFNAIGTIIVASVLIYKGFWWVCLAFIFSLGMSYTGYIQSRNQYKQVINLKNQIKSSGKNKEELKDQEVIDILNEKSPTRQKTMKIKFFFGRKLSWILMIISVVVWWIIINPATKDIWWRIAMVILIIITYLILYFGALGKLASYIFERRYITKIK